MNKKLFVLVVALFVTTGAQAVSTISAFTTQLPTTVINDFQEPAFSAEAAVIDAKSRMYNSNNTLIGFGDRELKMKETQAAFEQQVQAGFFVIFGAMTVLFVGCTFAEWFQEFKLRNAEKAKLIAELQCKTARIKLTCDR